MSAIPAWHMNKEHWPDVRLESDVPDSVIRSLIRDGYDTVAIAQIVLLLVHRRTFFANERTIRAG